MPAPRLLRDPRSRLRTVPSHGGRLASIALLGALTALGANSLTAASDELPTGRIAYQSVVDGNLEIFLMDPDGGSQTRLTDHPADDSNPRWSPDGKQIVFVSERDGNAEIFVMDADGRNVRQITAAPGQDTYPSMSPDGRMIVFESYRDGHAEIYRINADGSGAVRLTHFAGQVDVGDEAPAGNGNPSWSPEADH